MDLPWLVWAIIGAFGVGAFNAYLEGTRNSVPQGLVYKHIYLSIVLIIAGIFSAFTLLFYNQ